MNHPLLDPRTGLITRLDQVEAEPWWPSGLNVCTASVAAISDLLPWPADRVATGTAFHDPERALMSAAGEAIERYCGNFVPADLRRASHRELAAAGENALDPATFALYSASQYAEPGCPFVPFTADLPVLWMRGTTLDGPPVWVPASLVFVNYLVPPRAAEPATNYAMLAGLAAGPDLRFALTSGLEEIIERDATVIWWANRLPAAPVDVADARLAHLLRPDADLGPGWGRASGDLRYRVVSVPTTFDVAVIGVLLHDPALGIHTFGVAARPDPVPAVAKAMAEAVTLRIYSVGLLEPDGAIHQAVEDGVLSPDMLKPHRPDRAYAASYRSDFRDVVDLACHSQIWLDPAMAKELEPITGPADPVTLDDLPTITGDVCRAYLDRIEARGLRAHAVDLTTPDVAVTGARVVRVVVPGAYSNPPAAFPFLGGDRLYTDPVRLGLRAAPLAEADVNLVPLPHT
ncbi:YcaO-like family protein [Herbidospora cretacea]|uniref:YcaO-like family protein n=1 Tax=Herbidospora cretacea TaxID=28444 RepID=UPI00077421CD|nr:YcaO-like family protein [Herbidospora cretacea]